MKDTPVSLRGSEVLQDHRALSCRGCKTGEHNLELLGPQTCGSEPISFLCTSIDGLSKGNDMAAYLEVTYRLLAACLPDLLSTRCRREYIKPAESEGGGRGTSNYLEHLGSTFYGPTGCEVKQKHNGGVFCQQRHENKKHAPRMSLPLYNILDDLH